MAEKKQKLGAADFVHLHNHTQYSLLDGLTKVPELIDYVKSVGMNAVAVTDHGTLSGAIEFYTAAKEASIKPIIGIETYIASRKLSDKEAGKDKIYYHLTLLANSIVGYQNLMQLATIANLEGFYYRPRIDRETLAKYSEGLTCLSGCINGEVPDALRNDDYELAKQIATWYKKTFGKNYYLEIADSGHPDHPAYWAEQGKVNTQLIKLAEELAIPAVVTCDAHYLKHKDQEAHEILLCVQTGSFLSDEKRMSLKEFELHVTNPKEVIDRWSKDYPDFITNSRDIAKNVDLKIDLGNILIPKFPVPSGETEKSYLEKQVYRGLVRRYLPNYKADADGLSIKEAEKLLDKSIVDRAVYELNIVEQMGFNGYFLIIADFINWGKSRGIVFGPGRGSAAGSIIAYSLNITELDPLEYDLLFERFLNPDRISMPDIDIDIQDSRREEVIQYCVDKYGKDRVANIVTFGRMAARNAVRDVARVLQVPYVDADRLAKMIPPPIQGRHIPLKESLVNNAELKKEYQDNEVAKKVFDLAMQLEGTIRSHGVHAAGVVIAPEEIVRYTPLEMAQKGVIATQYSMGPIEDLGLLKMDFLGLSNLTIIKNTLRIIKRVYNQNIDINNIPLDDPKTYELLGNGDTTGVFQFESAGMKRYLKELKPTVFEDIVAMGALYRPGPMQFIEDFIARKHGTKKIEYIHPMMETALKNTYGVLVYQEQVMQISKDLCGFTGGQADTLRKGIAKKIPSVLAKIRIDFIEGAIKHSGADRALMEKFWKQLEDFAAYCFNKSHAACYGMISYQTAYLKAHYPTAFMAALMTSDYDDTDRLAIEIAECQHIGIKVLPPDVNESFVEFGVVPGKNQIRFGMTAIKNVGTSAVDEILRARADKNFDSLEDFLTRVNCRIVNRKALESLIKAGALDLFAQRDLLLFNLDLILAYANRQQKHLSSGQTDIFGEDLPSAEMERVRLSLQTPDQTANSHTQLLWERELLGLYLSHNPLESFQAILSEQAVPLAELKPEHDGKAVKAGGSITDFREITTKNGQKMGFVKLEDKTGEVEAVVFPSVFQQTLGLWERDRVVLIRGKINSKDKDGNQGQEVKIMVDDAREITLAQAEAYSPTGKHQKIPAKSSKTKDKQVEALKKNLYIRVRANDEQTLVSLKQALDLHNGEMGVVLVLGDDDKKQAIKLPSGISHSEDALSSLTTLVGKENIVIK